MREFLNLLIDRYKGNANANVDFGRWFEKNVCNQVFDIQKQKQAEKQEKLQSFRHRLLLIQETKNRSATMKDRTKLLFLGMEEEIFKTMHDEEKLSLEHVIYKLLIDLPTVNNFDFTQVNTHELIIKALKAWEPQTDLQANFHKKLLECLPLAMRKQGLNLICQDYKNHLENEISNSIPDNNLPKQIKVKQFITENPDGKQNFNTSLNSAIQKYRAVDEMQQTLTQKVPVSVQLKNFNAVYQAKQNILEPSRDNQAKAFCKKVLDFFSGYQFSNWIWGTKGKETGKKIERVSNLNFCRTLAGG